MRRYKPKNHRNRIGAPILRVYADTCISRNKRFLHELNVVGDPEKDERVRISFRPYQLPIFHDRSSGILVLHWSRQIGKSFTLAAWAVDRLLTRPGRLVTVLSNSRENGAEFVAKCAEVCQMNGTAFVSVDKSRGVRFQNMRMEVRIRSHGKVGRIKVLAANPRTARGFSGDLILDEFAFHEDSAAIWEAAEPILASNPDFLCRIASTGNGRHNLFYRMASGLGFTSNVAADVSPRVTDASGFGVESRMRDCPVSADRGSVSRSIDTVRTRCGSQTRAPSAAPALPLEVTADVSPRVTDASEFQEAMSKLKLELQTPEQSGPSEDRGSMSRSIDTIRTRCGSQTRVPSDAPALPLEVAADMSPRVTDASQFGVQALACTTPATGMFIPNPALRTPHSALGILVGTGINRSRTGFNVSRVTRTQAHEMGVRIFDPNTREPITPDQARAQALDRGAYDQNYECVFADENLTLLSHELITAAEHDDVGFIREQDWSNPISSSFSSSSSSSVLDLLRSAHGPIYAGFDVARKGDLSVITIIEDFKGLKLVRAILRMQNLRLPEQQERLGEICRLPRFRRAAIDMTGLGLGLFEYAQKKFGPSKIHGINFASSVPATRAIRLNGGRRETARVTEAMAMELLQTYEDRRIQHPADQRLRDDLRKPQKVTTPGGRVSIAATRDEAGHADHFWSFALALEAAAHGGGCGFQVIKRPPRIAWL